MANLPVLHITQWREHGDDEDQLDARLMSDPKGEAFRVIAQEQELRVIDGDTPLEAGSIQLICLMHIRDGQIYLDENQKRFRLRIESVEENHG